jgi:IS1 family transposase
MMASMNRLTTEQRVRIVGCLVEGMSIRATARMTGASTTTVMKLLGDMGLVCSIHMDRVMRDLSCERVQCDEIWSFVGSKQKNVPDEKRGEWGDVWTWVAIDADTKLVPTYLVGGRDLDAAHTFMRDLAKRLTNRIQLSTDGHLVYATAVRGAFHGKVDYAQVVKVYGSVDSKNSGRYSPPKLRECAKVTMSGNPDPEHISTSYVERQNLTMRMSMRRFTRLTNAFSKKVENHVAAISLHFAHYNLCRIHASLDGKTPAMAAGVSDHVWTLPELVGLLVNAEGVPTKRGSYKKRASAA